MRRWLSLQLVVAVCLGAAAQAQIDPEPNGIGIYADMAATVTSITAEPDVPFEVYLMITRPSPGNGIAGWACGIDVPPNAVIWGWNVAGNRFMNVGTPPDFEVGLGYEPLESADVVLLMTFIVWLLDSEPAEFYVRENAISPGDYEWPVYLDNANWDTLIQLHPWPRDLSQPAFCFNPDDGTPAAGATWGQVKALYQ